MKLLFEILVSAILHPVAVVLMWINLAGRRDLNSMQKAIWAIVAVRRGWLLAKAQPVLASPKGPAAQPPLACPCVTLINLGASRGGRSMPALRRLDSSNGMPAAALPARTRALPPRRFPAAALLIVREERRGDFLYARPLPESPETSLGFRIDASPAQS